MMKKPSLVQALDVSMYGGTVNMDKWLQARRRGFQLAIVGAWHGSDANAHARDTLYQARQAGMETAAYAVLNSLTGSYSIGKAAAACGNDEWDCLSFVALDCEVDFNEDTLKSALAELRERQAGRVCIYTGDWFWDGRLGNPTWGADMHLPLWDANYNRPPGLALPEPYGGWSGCIGHQYQGTNTRVGFSADCSVLDKEWVSGQKDK